MIARLVLQTILLLAVTGGILFGSAGTIRWPAGWVFLVELTGGSLLVGLWLAKHSPELLGKRLAGVAQKSQPLWDKIVIALAGLLFAGWLAAMGRWHDSMPLVLRSAGAVLILVCFRLVQLTFRENAFTAPVVQIQERQQVVDSGPYGLVRHPMYASTLLFYAGTTLLLGSWIGLAFVPIFAIVLAVRAVLEERVLAAGLKGYAQYTARVRFRLIPHIW